MKDRRLHYVYDFVGSLEQMVVADRDVPTGDDQILSASFDKTGEDPPGVANGTLSLYHGDTLVGQAQIKTQPGKFVIGGEGLCVGRDSGAGVTDDYPGEHALELLRGHDQAGGRRRQRRALPQPRA